jgi:methyltransferase (TIGR00027 family)
MGDPLIRDVSDTAFMVAAYRAIENDRADALFRDPLALPLAGARGRRFIEALAGRGRGMRRGARHTRAMVWVIAIRTRIIDEMISAAIAGGIDAILNLGAGLDTRPYRLSVPQSLHWIEVDYPHLIELKNGQLAAEQPRCHLQRVALDLADLPARKRLLSDTGARFGNVLVLTEGLIPYLSVEDAGRLADDLRAEASFRYWIVEYFSTRIMRYGRRAGYRRSMRNAPFRFGPADYFGFFRQHGWGAGEIRYLWDEGQRLGRPLPLPRIVRWSFALLRLFSSPRRRAELRRSMGYVLLEPLSGGS